MRVRLLSLALVAGCMGSSATSPPLIGTGMPILFIGNSHTYMTDAPGVLQALADSAGEDVAVMTMAGPNLALIDHWNLGEAARQIRAREWKYVVMQQGWTPAGVCQDTLRLAAKKFDAEIRAVGGTPALLQIWPPSNRTSQWQGTIESYRFAAKDVNGLLFPAAEAWREVAVRDSTINLYYDGLHANGAGAYLVGLVMYARIFQKTPVGLPFRVTTRDGLAIVIPPDIATVLQQVAADIGLAATPDVPPTATPVITSTC